MFLLLLACTPPQPDDLAWSLSLLVRDVLFDLDERVGYENPEVDTGIYYPEEAVGSWERSYGENRWETWKGTVSAEAALPAEPVALCGETACPHDGWALDLAWTDLLSRPIPEHDLCQGAIPDSCHLDRTIPRFRMDAKLTGVANHLLPPSPDLERDISAQLSGQIRPDPPVRRQHEGYRDPDKRLDRL